MIYALGDSFTNPGYGATSGHGYIAVLNRLIAQSIVNKGVNGGAVADLTTNLCSITITGNDASIVELGTNDHYQYGNDTTKIGYFKAGILAVIAYLATPNKLLGKNTASVGTWANTTSFGIGKQTTTPGSTITFSVSGTSVYFGTIQFSGVDGSYRVEIDGVDKGTFQTNALGLTTALNMPCGQKVLRFDGLIDGAHNVKITALSGSVYAEWCAGNSQVDKPPVYVCKLTRLNTNAYANCPRPISDTTLALYNAALSDVIAQLVADGFPVIPVDVAPIYFPDVDTYSDGIHPNDTGHCKIAMNLQTAINANGILALTPAQTYLDTSGNYWIGEGLQRKRLNTY